MSASLGNVALSSNDGAYDGVDRTHGDTNIDKEGYYDSVSVLA